MSRFTKHEKVLIAPGCCFVCRGNKGPFVDCGFSHQWDNTIPPSWDGAVYICVTCIDQMAVVAGIRPPDINISKAFADAAIVLNSAKEDMRLQIDLFQGGVNGVIDRVTDALMRTSVDDLVTRHSAGVDVSAEPEVASGTSEVKQDGYDDESPTDVEVGGAVGSERSDDVPSGTVDGSFDGGLDELRLPDFESELTL